MIPIRLRKKCWSLQPCWLQGNILAYPLALVKKCRRRKKYEKIFWSLWSSKNSGPPNAPLKKTGPPLTTPKFWYPPPPFWIRRGHISWHGINHYQYSNSCRFGLKVHSWIFSVISTSPTLCITKEDTVKRYVGNIDCHNFSTMHSCTPSKNWKAGLSLKYHWKYPAVYN